MVERRLRLMLPFQNSLVLKGLFLLNSDRVFRVLSILASYYYGKINNGGKGENSLKTINSY